MANILYNFILLGNHTVGKTTIFKKLFTGKFLTKTMDTIGIEKKNKEIIVQIDENGKKVDKNFVITLSDTAGQEIYRTITYNYYRGSDGILLLYSIVDRKSFDSIEEWIHGIRNTIDSKYESRYSIILLGNKLDLVEKDESNRAVKEEEAIEACNKYEMIWGGEISTKDIKHEDLENMFKDFVRQIYEKIGVKKTQKQQLKKVQKYKNKKKFKCFGV